MATDSLWKQLKTPEVLTRGWHLARQDSKQDFSEDIYSTDVFGVDLKSYIRETINRLSTNTYQPHPLLRIEVPKGSLGIRPGAVIPIQDRVVVSAIVLLLAPVVDKKIPDSVYSWRLKDPLPKNGPIFKESDITDIPYLKRSTIREAVNPFEPWYVNWPEFDEDSRNAFLDEGFLYLATTDIAAYFENIQLPILRDQLLGHFPHDPAIVNFLFSFLEAWALRTADGRPHLRGIPQGNFVSSFLGNIFLLPLDLTFFQMQQDHDILYYRYMDDARIFTKHIADARRAVFTMDRELRKLHLNVQTAKTKILDEKHHEISSALIDERVDELSNLIDELRAKDLDNITSIENSIYLARLNSIAHEEGSGGQKILGSKRQLEGLTSRAFFRWIYAHCLLRSDDYVGRLLYEIQLNPDYKLTKKLVTTSKLFPRKRKLETYLMDFINSDKNIFPHQEAECLHVLRYLSNLHDKTIEHAKTRLHDIKEPSYLRTQAAYLLSRTELDARYFRRIEGLFNQEQDPYVQVALSMLLVQKRESNSEVVRSLVFHPNEKLREIGKLYRYIKNDEKIARERLKHIFREETPWLVCDNMPFLHLMSMSSNSKIRKALLDAIRVPRNNTPIVGIREILRHIFTRTKESLKGQNAA
jgi:hypothetical protein